MIPGRIIGIAGRKGSGKTTLAEAMVSHGWVHDSFAAPIRRFMCNLFDIEPIDLEAIKELPQRALGNRTPREVMQVLGTEWMRSYCGQNVWIDALRARIAPLYATGANAVISDVRFENEATFIRNLGGVVVWIERPGQRRDDPHVSELGLPTHLIDHVIENDRDLEYLYAMAKILATLT